MMCFRHPEVPAVGVCAGCSHGLCPECVGRERPRLACRSCVENPPVDRGFEYISQTRFGDWPLVHIVTGRDALTGQPKTARGVIAVGNVAVGMFALGGAAFGLFSLGGLSVGLLTAFGGVAIGAGLSVGGVAVGAIALGGAVFGYAFAIGGAALGPATIAGAGCSEAGRQFLEGFQVDTTELCRKMLP